MCLRVTGGRVRSPACTAQENIGADRLIGAAVDAAASLRQRTRRRSELQRQGGQVRRFLAGRRPSCSSLLAVAALVVAAAASRARRRRRPTSRSASCFRTRSRPFAGCSSTLRCDEGASRRPASRRSINNALNDPLKQKAQAQACIAAGAKVVIETALDNGSAAVDREALHLEGRQGDRLRPPGDRRHRVGLRHVRRQGGRQGAGQRRHRRDEGEGHVQGAARSPSSGAARPTRTRSGSRAATTPSSTRSSRAAR